MPSLPHIAVVRRGGGRGEEVSDRFQIEARRRRGISASAARPSEEGGDDRAREALRGDGP